MLLIYAGILTVTQYQLARETSMRATPNFIDDQFIQAWHPRYDETEDDEPEYRRLLNKVSLEMETDRSLIRQTFTEILNWKSARVKGRIDWSAFETYTNAIAKCQESFGMERMRLLIDLPGIGAPVASTFLHFIFPSSFPIIDRRTVDVLRHFGYIQYKSTGIAQYPAFMAAVLAIRDHYPKWSLREIDRAVFSFHKQNTSLFGTLSKPNTPGNYHRAC
jgi:hypothetical protein